MGGRAQVQPGVFVAMAAVALVGCHASAPSRSHDAVALYNDSSRTVRVIGCVGCGAAGESVAAGKWLTLNLPPTSSRLELRGAASTTCLMVVDGVDTGKPRVVKVSESAASAC